VCAVCRQLGGDEGDGVARPVGAVEQRNAGAEADDAAAEDDDVLRRRHGLLCVVWWS
jgi:hypothetical protein